jgi:ribosomal protein S18 acetylase RimI-like enzyme
MIVRRLGPGDEGIIEALATREPRFDLLKDDKTIFLVALDGDRPLGFVFGYELPRRHGDPSIFLVYEIEVNAACRGQGVGSRLMSELRRICRGRGIGEGFVLTEPDNEAANALYAAAGGERREVIEWDFRYEDS